jgi:hypothetical protein
LDNFYFTLEVIMSGKMIKRIIKVFTIYGPQIWLTIFIANLGVITIIRSLAANQSCMTQQQIDSDNRCLYVYQSDIYEQGTRNHPHKGNDCGINVTGIIPNGHINDTNKYLLPNYVAPLCSSNPTSTPTAQPTAAPTASPSPIPTQQPTAQPTAVPTPTATPTLEPTLAPDTTRAPTSSPTPTPEVQPTSTPSPTPGSAEVTATPTDEPFVYHAGGFGELLGRLIQKEEPVKVASKQVDQYKLIYWTTVFSYISFVLVLLSGIYMVVDAILNRLQNR